MGRDGKKYARDVRIDVDQFHQKGITMILCLLSDVEMRCIGTNVKNYEQACAKIGIKLVKYPIIEMAPPSNISKQHSEVVQPLCDQMTTGNGHILLHCRGGVGRAGLLACSLLTNLCVFKTHIEVMQFVRGRRDRRCVESMK